MEGLVMEVVKALAIMTSMPEQLKVILKNLPPETWNLEEIDGQGLLMQIATHQSVQREEQGVDLIKWLALKNQQKSEKEKMAWVEACIACVMLSPFPNKHGQEIAREKIFLEYWKVAKGWLDKEQKLKVLCQVLLKTNAAWIDASIAVIKESEIDLNISVNVEKILKLNSVEVSAEKHKNVPLILLAKNKAAIEACIAQGVEISEMFGNEVVRDVITKRTKWYESEAQRKQVLNFIEKIAPKEWTQERAWQEVMDAKSSSDIERLLKATKKLWPKWVGSGGESLVQHIAIYRPYELIMVTSRPECPVDWMNHKDKKDRDALVWFVVGAASKSEKWEDEMKNLFSTNCAKEMRKIYTDREAAELSIDAFLLKNENLFSGIFSNVNQTNDIGFTFRELHKDGDYGKNKKKGMGGHALRVYMAQIQDVIMKCVELNKVQGHQWRTETAILNAAENCALELSLESSLGAWLNTPNIGEKYFVNSLKSPSALATVAWAINRSDFTNIEHCIKEIGETPDGLRNRIMIKNNKSGSHAFSWNANTEAAWHEKVVVPFEKMLLKDVAAEVGVKMSQKKQDLAL